MALSKETIRTVTPADDTSGRFTALPGGYGERVPFSSENYVETTQNCWDRGLPAALPANIRTRSFSPPHPKLIDGIITTLAVGSTTYVDESFRPRTDAHVIENKINTIKAKFRATLLGLPYTVDGRLLPYLVTHIFVMDSHTVGSKTVPDMPYGMVNGAPLLAKRCWTVPWGTSIDDRK